MTAPPVDQARLAELTRRALDAPELGDISISKARRLARRALVAKPGERKDIAYADPTGERAVRNVARQRDVEAAVTKRLGVVP